MVIWNAFATTGPHDPLTLNRWFRHRPSAWGTAEETIQFFGVTPSFQFEV